ncbi:MAG: 2,3,4,5-tetrahydropyridine-2,6-dicarboxylate N-succinyltransferase, partial [Gammaproteobacteria bacterium]|nr:2,3,4,5-tetrahydropyridine-2,6-dicarboxylate N-succinyltransferase [Gammaproteobacteria bacterium]
MNHLEKIITDAWEHRAEITPRSAGSELRTAINEVLDLLDSGAVRVAEPDGNGWKVNQWLKMATLLSFRIEDN